VLLTRLELFLRRTNMKPTGVARLAGYSRQHFLRLRLGEGDATRGGILAVTSACRKLSRQRVTPEVLFERAALFLKGPGQRLSHAHSGDRRRLDDILSGSLPSPLSDVIMASGVESETAVRHLLRAAKERLDTAPGRAADIYEAAGRMAAALRRTPQELAASLRAHALKGCSNALRMTGQYDQSLTCLEVAARLFASARYCMDEAGHVEYARAATLFKMELWDDALTATRAARKRFVQSKDSRRVAHAELLEGNILFERGDWDAARNRWMRLRGPLGALKDKDALARVALNLGACEIRRNEPVSARAWLNEASGAFRKLRNTAELARTRWNMATWLATFRNPARAVRALRHAQRTFESLGMWVDAACVGLDMTELMIELGIPDDVLARHAAEVASTFARSGLAVSLAHALEQLRNITHSADRRRIVRMVRAALRDAETSCSEVATETLQ